jgi:hypothetical protein
VQAELQGKQDQLSSLSSPDTDRDYEPEAHESGEEEEDGEDGEDEDDGADEPMVDEDGGESSGSGTEAGDDERPVVSVPMALFARQLRQRRRAERAAPPAEAREAEAVAHALGAHQPELPSLSWLQPGPDNVVQRFRGALVATCTPRSRAAVEAFLRLSAAPGAPQPDPWLLAASC